MQTYWIVNAAADSQQGLCFEPLYQGAVGNVKYSGKQVMGVSLSHKLSGTLTFISMYDRIWQHVIFSSCKVIQK